MTDSMIERVTRAMSATLIPGSRTVMAADVISKELISFMARAAIEAMREPTEAMLKAARRVTSGASPEERMALELAEFGMRHDVKMRRRLAAMVDAALKEQP